MDTGLHPIIAYVPAYRKYDRSCFHRN